MPTPFAALANSADHTPLAAYIHRAALSPFALIALVLVALALPNPTAAQMPAPVQDRPIALVGGTLHTVSDGVIENGTLVFQNGRITALGTGAQVQVPSGAEQVDATGMHIYPGLIDGWSQMGLFEIGGFDVTIDLNELGPVNPNARAHVAFHPESRHIGTTRSNGVLVTLSSPGGGVISGMSAAMMLDGWTWETMTLKPHTGLMVQWPPPGNDRIYREGQETLREAFAQARAYKTAREAADAGGPHVNHDSRWEAMIPVLEGEIPVVVNASRLKQIRDAVDWAEEEGVRLVILGGGDADLMAEELARREIPVLLTSVLSTPARNWEPYDHTFGLPARLHEAGVPFAIVGGSSAPYANRLPYEAGVAMAHGLPEEEAVRALTLSPARILGIDERVGSLEVGKDATLLITTGNPLEYATTIERAFIEGRDIDLMDAHRQFYERYSEKVRRMRGVPVSEEDGIQRD
jgi:imidazolonepropionase-like amidohydrolase